MPGVVGNLVELQGEEEQGTNRLGARGPAPWVEDEMEAGRAHPAGGDAGAELVGAELTAAAGARPSAGEVLRCTGKRAERLYGLLASPGTR